MKMMRPQQGNTLLDVGCGTGYFSRRFVDKGLVVTSLDLEPAMINYAQTQTTRVNYVNGSAEQLPFADNSFDYCTAITSLCFVDDPKKALTEMWRVNQRGVALGLLNRNSLLYRQKSGLGRYAGARWNVRKSVKKWISALKLGPARIQHKTAIFFPDGDRLARLAEMWLPSRLLFGGFLAIYIK